MKIKYLLFLSFLVNILNVFPSFAQEIGDDISTPNVIMPSPEVAALAKYVEMPMNHTTGVPEIAIPIHTVKEGDIGLPISLSYYAGGIKVEEEASSVGLGWSLMAGGVVSRMIKGKADDTNGGYMFNNFSVDEVHSLNPFERSSYFEIIDTEPDVFFFNFMGYSGRFQYVKGLNGTGEFKQLKENNVIIEYDTQQGGEINRFVIITPDGTKYYFGSSKNFNRRATEKSLITQQYLPASPTQMIESITAWNLLEIENFSGDVIKLHYIYQTELHASINSQSKLQKYPQNSISNCDCPSSTQSDFSKLTSSVSVSTRLRPILEYINSTHESIHFIYDKNHKRQDLNGSYPLRKITLINRKNNEKVREYELAHTYFMPKVGEKKNFSNIPYSEYRSKRLKLLSIQERGFINNRVKELPPYKFEYNEEKLPHKFSFAQDYWGLYNGKDNNQHLLPPIMIDNNILHHNHGNAERSVNPQKTQAGTLTKITYPTGGYTLYKYENNKVSTYNRSDASRYSLRNVTKPIAKYFVKNRENEHSLFPDTYTYTFEIKENMVGLVSFEIFVTGTGCGELLTNFACDFFISMKGLDNDYSSGVYSGRSFSQNLEPGTYEITAKGNFSGNSSNTSDFSVKISWKEEDVETIGSSYEFVSGGLRIKTIEKYDRQETLLLKKSYEYTRETTQSEKNTSGLNIASSGNMAWWPQFHFSDYKYTSICCETLNHTLITSNSHRPLFSYNGSNVMYEKVIEYTDNVKDVLGSINSFKTEYTFDFVLGVSSPGSDALGVFQGEMYSEPLRGNLIEKRHYEKVANIHKLLSKETFTYENIMNHYTDYGVLIIPSKELGHMGQTCGTHLGSSGTIACTAPLTRYAAYDQRSIVHRLKNTSKTEYFSTGEITQRTDYTYQSNPILASHIQTRYYEINNSSKTIEKFYKYPFDLSQNSQMQNLVNENRIEQPIEIIDKTNGIQSKIINTLYSTNSTTSGKTLPTAIQVGKNTRNSLETKVNFNRYDSKGNFLEVTENGGKTISYIWGYQDQYPVVKLENINYNSIPSDLITRIKDLSNTGTETQLRNAINSLRAHAALSNAMLTGYIYSPLVGIAQIIDPKGDEIYYHYDAFGRLESIKDKLNNVIEEYEYHYSGNN